MIKIYTDGASRGNPGESAFAFIFTEKGKVIFLSAEYIGSATNNIAEYRAIISALREARNRNIDRASLISDSELVISQINGAYKTKAAHLKKLNEEVKELRAQFVSIKFSNAPRTDEFIGIADKLCNTILDLA